jgi:hypothetical protein
LEPIPRKSTRPDVGCWYFFFNSFSWRFADLFARSLVKLLASVIATTSLGGGFEGWRWLALEIVVPPAV